VLSIESIGTAWEICSNPSIGSPPTRLVGLVRVVQLRVLGLERFGQLGEQVVVLPVGHDRVGVDVVRPVRPASEAIAAIDRPRCAASADFATGDDMIDRTCP
jgi:hypothetical protein